MERKSGHNALEELGNLTEGRPNLGPMVELAAYRLMHFSLREVLAKKYSARDAAEIFRAAGKLAGTRFCSDMLDRTLPFDQFLAQLVEKLVAYRIGIVRLEEADLEKLNFVMTVAEDMECSGLPNRGENICEYDEGFIAGILENYLGTPFVVQEVDCWASGGNVCRFRIHPIVGESLHGRH